MPPNGIWEEDASQPFPAVGSFSVLSIPWLVDASLQSLSPTSLFEIIIVII